MRQLQAAGSLIDLPASGKINALANVGALPPSRRAVTLARIMPLGRPSALGRATTEGIATGRLLPGERLPPPPDLSDAERAEWERITAPLPPGFLTLEHSNLLRELVRVSTFAARLGAITERMLEDVADAAPDSPRWRKVQEIMRTHGFLVEKIVLLSRSLKLTKQSRWDNKSKHANRHASATPPPWLDWPGAKAD